MARLAVLLLALVLSGCGSSGGCGRYEDCDADAELDVRAADEPVAADVAAEDVDQPEFDDCTEDCSGHEAGFEWAREQDVTDASDCSGNSGSFIEGCEAFAEERQVEAEGLADDEPDPDEDSGRF